jgi:hypothetical protein
VDDLEKIFSEFIKENEDIAWCGKPKQGILIRDMDLIAIPMSLILFGFALILDYAVFYYKAGFQFLSLSFFITLLLFYGGIIRFFANAHHRKNLFYCITTKRILVISGKKRKLSTLPLKNIEDPEITVEKDGTGFITFGTANPIWPWLFGGFYFTSENVPGLELIPNAEYVYEILLQQLHNQVNPEVIARLTPGKEDMN